MEICLLEEGFLGDERFSEVVIRERCGSNACLIFFGFGWVSTIGTDFIEI